MSEDITVLDDDSKRKCLKHGIGCPLNRLAGFGAGFSCTSYSNLNKDAPRNASAMERAQQDEEALWAEFQQTLCLSFGVLTHFGLGWSKFGLSPGLRVQREECKA